MQYDMDVSRIAIANDHIELDIGEKKSTFLLCILLLILKEKKTI